MKVCSERCTELEDRLAKENNLRKQIERELQDVYDEKNKVGYDEESYSSHENSESDSSSDESDDEKSTTRKRSRASNRQRSKIKKKSEVHQKVRNSAVKERQSVKGLKKQNEDHGGYKIISEGSKSVRKLNPETHMKSQDHLQNATEYLRKYQKKSVEVGDSDQMQTTHTLKFRMWMMTISDPDQKK